MLRIVKPLLCLLVFSAPSLAAIINGGFELNDNGWTVASTNFGSPWCTTASCGTGGGKAGPHSGNGWLWFGGIAGSAEVGSASQSVVVSATGSPSLNFWVWDGQGPFGAADYFLVTVDGSEVFRINQANSAAYSAYSQVTISLGAWANDANHLIRFEESNGTVGQGFNLSVDDVSISDSSAPEPASALLLGAGALLLAAFRRVHSA